MLKILYNFNFFRLKLFSSSRSDYREFETTNEFLVEAETVPLCMFDSAVTRIDFDRIDSVQN
jgi:hypothetical protein